MKWRGDRFLLQIISAMVVILIVASVCGCASMTEEYWQDRWEELSDAEKEIYPTNPTPGRGMPIQVCDLTDCIFVWVY